MSAQGDLGHRSGPGVRGMAHRGGDAPRPAVVAVAAVDRHGDADGHARSSPPREPVRPRGARPRRAGHVPPHPCLAFRTGDGSYNDLARPTAGTAWTRFGRNVAPTPHPSQASVMEPNPRDVSELLMKRGPFQEFEHGNALLAAWIQFMIRDWFNHGETIEQRWGPFPAPDGAPDPDPHVHQRHPGRPAGHAARWRGHPRQRAHPLVGRLAAVPVRSGAGAPVALCRPGPTVCRGLLPDGNIRDDLMELLPEPANPGKQPETVPGFWVGLGMMMSLFAKEHNSICAALKEHEHIEDPEVLYATARLVNTALMTKIHTLDWTAAVLGHRDDPVGHRGRVVGAARQEVVREAGQATVAQRAAVRHPGFSDEGLRRAVLAHRGVRRRLSHAQHAAGPLRAA